MVTRSSTGRRKVDFTFFHKVVPVLSSTNHIPPLAPVTRPPLHESRRSSSLLTPPHVPPILQVPRPLSCHPVVAPVSQTTSSQTSQPSPPPIIPPILQPPTALPSDGGTADSPLIPSGDRNHRGMFENTIENLAGGFKGSGSDGESFPVRNHIIKASRSRRKGDPFGLRSRRKAVGLEVEHLTDKDLEAWEGREGGFKRQIADLEEQLERWRQLVVELAIRVQQSPILHSPDAESHSLLESSKKALQEALPNNL